MIGADFTVEAWIDVDPNGSDGNRTLFGAPGADQAHTGPSVWISDGTKVGVGFGDGSTWHESVSGELLTAGWHHLGVTFDGAVVQVYLDGVPAFGTADFKGIVPVATAVTELGAATGGFAGVLDEVRIWQVARGASSLRAGMHRRLTGLEPGLVSYFRLDEGRGTSVADLAGGDTTGLVTGATWVTSDAPIADSVGLSRSTVRFDGHAVTGGLSAALYYEQESVVSGYDATPKPMKQAARVMLAAAVASSAGQSAIAVLDHGVAADGTLARLTTDVALTDLVLPQTAGASPNSLLDELATLESQRAGLDARVSALSSTVTDLSTTVDQLTGLLAGGTTPVVFTGCARRPQRVGHQPARPRAAPARPAVRRRRDRTGPQAATDRRDEGADRQRQGAAAGRPTGSAVRPRHGACGPAADPGASRRPSRRRWPTSAGPSTPTSCCRCRCSPSTAPG